jgi:hypothetical protein
MVAWSNLHSPSHEAPACLPIYMLPEPPPQAVAGPGMEHKAWQTLFFILK